MAKKYLELVNGKVATREATVQSAGASNAGEVAALDSTGRLDVTVMPIGVGPDVSQLETSDDLTPGQYVNIYDVAGAAKVRLADASNGRDAHGFVKEAFVTGAQATVYFEGPNEDLSGLSIGSRQYLGVAGQVTATPRTSGIHQFLGYAVKNDTINTDIDDVIVLN
jgi:hypothetical protein